MIGQHTKRSKPVLYKDILHDNSIAQSMFVKTFVPISGWNDPLLDPIVVSPSYIVKDVHTNKLTCIFGCSHSPKKAEHHNY